jgi:hypothetical protein
MNKEVLPSDPSIPSAINNWHPASYKNSKRYQDPEYKS